MKLIIRDEDYVDDLFFFLPVADEMDRKRFNTEKVWCV